MRNQYMITQTPKFNTSRHITMESWRDLEDCQQEVEELEEEVERLHNCERELEDCQQEVEELEEEVERLKEKLQRFENIFKPTYAPPKPEDVQESDIKIVMKEAQVSRDEAIKALKVNKNDPVDAILWIDEMKAGDPVLN